MDFMLDYPHEHKALQIQDHQGPGVMLNLVSDGVALRTKGDDSVSKGNEGLKKSSVANLIQLSIRLRG